jgi:hypothetical protein
MNDTGTAPYILDVNVTTGTASGSLSVPTFEFNPGPPSTSRKKRSQIGAKGLPRKRAEKRSWLDSATAVKKFKAKKRARKAIGARGMKTNGRRHHTGRRAVPVVVES